MKSITSFINESRVGVPSATPVDSILPSNTYKDFIENSSDDMFCREFNNKYGLNNLICRRIDIDNHPAVYIVTGSNITRSQTPVFSNTYGQESICQFAGERGFDVYNADGDALNCIDIDDDDMSLDTDIVDYVKGIVRDKDYIIIHMNIPAGDE